MNPQAVATQYRTEIAALPRRDTPSLRALRKQWSAALKGEDAKRVVAIAKALEADAPQEGKWIAYELIRHHRAAFAAFDDAMADDFASRIVSWYATDAFGTILSGPAWAKGQVADDLIDAWSHSPDRWLRRCALVATVGLNASLPDGKGDPGRTFSLCRRMAADRDDMIEKAVSWAIRYLSQKDKAAVWAFMEEHGDSFRPRVRREVAHKLTTGLKNPRTRF